MKALLVNAPNAAFQMTDVPMPVPEPGQVLVRIAASGVNPLGTKIRAGRGGHARHPLPAILGIDLAGTVTAIGPGVVDFHLGEAVYGMTGGIGGVPGSLTEYAAVDAQLLAPKPAHLSMREAAALPLIAITAWEGLVDRAAGAGANGAGPGGRGRRRPRRGANRPRIWRRGIRDASWRPRRIPCFTRLGAS
jgi:NADPH2:quinone reductase